MSAYSPEQLRELVEGRYCLSRGTDPCRTGGKQCWCCQAATTLRACAEMAERWEWVRTKLHACEYHFGGKIRVVWIGNDSERIPRTTSSFYGSFENAVDAARKQEDGNDSTK